MSRRNDKYEDDDDDYDDDDDDDDYDDDEDDIDGESIPTYTFYRNLINEYHKSASMEILQMLPNVKPSERSIVTLLPRCNAIRPEIPNDDKEKILKELKLAYMHKNAVEYFGNYYDKLLTFGIELDANNDEELLKEDLNTSGGFVHVSDSEEKLLAMDKNILKNYNCIMRHARLNCWAKKVLEANPDIVTVDADFINSKPRYFKILKSDARYTMTQDFEMFNLNMCMKMISKGLYFYIVKLPNLRLNERFHFNIDSFKEQCAELTKLYENCIENGKPIPLIQQLPIYERPVLDILSEGVMLFIDELLNCFKVDQGKNIAPDLIQHIFQLLEVAVKADERVASILIDNFDRIQSILLSLLNLLCNDTIHAPLQVWASLELPIKDAFDFVDALLGRFETDEIRESSMSRGRNIRYKSHFATPQISKIITTLSPVILKAFKLRHKHPMIYLCAAKHFSNCSRGTFLWLVPIDVIQATFINDFVDVYKSIFKEETEISTTTKPGHCIAQIQEGDEMPQDVNYQSECKALLLEVFVHLCARSYEITSSQNTLAKWLLSLFINKGLMMIILENFSNGTYDKNTSQEFVALLQELSRERSCRKCLYDNKGKDLIIQLVQSDDSIIVCAVTLLLNRLCWDKLWRDFIVLMDPPLEKFVAKWMCSIAISFQRSAIAKLDVLEIVRYIPIRRLPSWNKNKKLPSSIPLTEEEKSNKWVQYHSIYPDLRSTNKFSSKCIELLLSRILLLCTNIHRLRFQDNLITRFSSISLLELLTIFYDWPGDCSFQMEEVILNYCLCGDFKPSSFSNPSLLVERICANFDYELELKLRKAEHYEGTFSCISTSMQLLQWLFQDVKDTNSEWYPIVNSVATKALDWKLQMCFGEYLTGPKPIDHILSETKIHNLREGEDDIIKTRNAPDLQKFCMNPACKFHSVYDQKIKMKICSRCQSAFYCDPKCQKDHWKSHKYECKA